MPQRQIFVAVIGDDHGNIITQICDAWPELSLAVISAVSANRFEAAVLKTE